MSVEEIATLTEQLQQARNEAAYYRKLAHECGQRRLKEAEDLSNLIDKLRRTEMVLMLARDEADAANRAKSQFLATMSHELRTPLTAIIGYSELLDLTLAPSADPQVLGDLGRIRAAGMHLLAIINDVLDLSKLEAGYMYVDCAPLTVSALLHSLADTIQPLARRNQNRFVIEGGDAAGVMLTDTIRLRQILINLVGNACKFTHAGVITLRVSVVPDPVGTDADLIQFAVCDTGIGISPDQLGLLFRDFVQIDASSTRKYGGTGLGLALSQRLARMLGGEITVISAVGIGSTFTLTLPRTCVVNTSPQPATPISLTSPQPASATATPTLNSMLEARLVLVIAEDQSVRKLLSRALTRPFLYAKTATSGPEGLKLAGTLLPDLIILDLLQAEQDSWATLHQLKADPLTCTIPVLLLTLAPGATRGMLLGAAAILHQPLDLHRLGEEVAAICKSYHGPLHMLLVTSNPDLPIALQGVSGCGDWTMSAAVDAQHALALFDQVPPGLVVIDLQLPGVDGIALIAAMRARPGGTMLPILVLAAKDLAQGQREQLNRSVAQVLQHGGLRDDDLLESVHALMRSYGLPTAQRGAA